MSKSWTSPPPRSLVPDPIPAFGEGFDVDARTRAEQEAADRLRDQWPGRWGDEVSPARMRRDLKREREEDKR